MLGWQHAFIIAKIVPVIDHTKTITHDFNERRQRAAITFIWHPSHGNFLKSHVNLARYQDLPVKLTQAQIGFSYLCLLTTLPQPNQDGRE